MVESLGLFDWAVIICFILLNLGIGLYFTKAASKNIASFFISGRSLGWFVAGISMTATAFANHTPIMITTLIRRYGLHYVWQHWALAIGVALAAVLFARLWRRLAIVTDIEFLETRYSGKWASTLRFWEGTTQALFFCPLMTAWCIKAMEVVIREATGLPEQYRLTTTLIVVVCSVALCAFSGLFGVVYSALLQMLVATVGSVILAIYAVNAVGGWRAMVEKLSALTDWPGHTLNILPTIGPDSSSGQMPFINIIGYFGLLWLSSAVMGRHQTQRLLACKDAKNASYGTLLFGVLYRCIICWPWIIAGACSIILLPNLKGVMDDSAYPRLIIALLPAGLKGLLVAGIIAAFISTIGALFTWGASYIVNDLYKRFFVRNASNKHYITMSRVMTIVVGAAGGLVAFLAPDILWLVTTAYVVWAGLVVVEIMRWMWWRQNGIGDLCAIIATWVFATLLVFGLFNEPVRPVIGWLGMDRTLELSSSMELLGLRMLLVTILATSTSVIVSLLTGPVPIEHLQKFVHKARPFKILWAPVIRKMTLPYEEAETIGRTLLSWGIGVASMFTMIYGLGKIFFGNAPLGIVVSIISVVLLWILIKRIANDFSGQKANEIETERSQIESGV